MKAAKNATKFIKEAAPIAAGNAVAAYLDNGVLEKDNGSYMLGDKTAKYRGAIMLVAGTVLGSVSKNKMVVGMAQGVVSYGFTRQLADTTGKPKAFGLGSIGASDDAMSDEAAAAFAEMAQEAYQRALSAGTMDGVYTPVAEMETVEIDTTDDANGLVP